jgi:hypothetical protein
MAIIATGKKAIAAHFGKTEFAGIKKIAAAAGLYMNLTEAGWVLTDDAHTGDAEDERLSALHASQAEAEAQKNRKASARPLNLRKEAMRIHSIHTSRGRRTLRAQGFID